MRRVMRQFDQATITTLRDAGSRALVVPSYLLPSERDPGV
jgi:hypothetical protein